MSFPFQIEMGPDRRIRADYYPAIQPSKGTLIICHGYKGFKDWGMFPYAAESLSKELDVIAFNFTHNGVGENLMEFTELERFAKNTYSRELEDLHVLVQAVRNGELPVEGIDSTQPLYLLGHSRGGGVSLIYCFDHPELINGVICWNGMTSLPGLFSDEEKLEMRNKGRTHIFNGRTKQQMPLDVEILEDLDRNEARFNTIARVKLSKLPIVLIQGSEDYQKLRKGSAELVEANPSISWIQVPEGTHTFGAVHPFQGTTKPLETAIRHTQQFIMKCNNA